MIFITTIIILLIISITLLTDVFHRKYKKSYKFYCYSLSTLSLMKRGGEISINKKKSLIIIQKRKLPFELICIGGDVTVISVATEKMIVVTLVIKAIS